MISTIKKIENIELGKGFELINVENDEEIIRGEFKVNNEDLTYGNPYGITTLFENELNKINSIPEIEDVEISNIFTKHYENCSHDYIVKFLAYTD